MDFFNRPKNNLMLREYEEEKKVDSTSLDW